jgi:hypothetical protein
MAVMEKPVHRALAACREYRALLAQEAKKETRAILAKEARKVSKEYRVNAVRL